MLPLIFGEFMDIELNPCDNKLKELIILWSYLLGFLALLEKYVQHGQCLLGVISKRKRVLTNRLSSGTNTFN